MTDVEATGAPADAIKSAGGDAGPGRRPAVRVIKGRSARVAARAPVDLL